VANWDLQNEKDGLEKKNDLGHYVGGKVMPTVQNLEVKLIYAKHQKTKYIK